MAELPISLSECRCLETLQLKANRLKSIPKTISSLNSLTYLDLSDNLISELPDELFTLPLRILLLSRNRLQQISTEIRHLSATLQELGICSNRLRSLPAGISSLTELRVLNVRNNQIKDVPSGKSYSFSIFGVQRKN